MKCPNCRCEVDRNAESCPYCGFVFPKQAGIQADMPAHRSRTSPVRQTPTATVRSSRTAEQKWQRRCVQELRIGQETVIWLLIILIVIHLLQLAAIILV